MPGSLDVGKPQIKQWFVENQSTINRIVDIGAGHGTYAKLLRENDICKNAEWIAIEAWEPYTKNLSYVYDKTIIKDVRIVDWDEIGQVDVTIAGDVLEHMTKNSAKFVVDNILNHSKTLVISIPICYLPQEFGKFDMNPYEEHIKPDWSHEEVMETWGDKVTKFYVPPKDEFQIGVYWLSK